MPKERKQDHVHDADPNNPYLRDRGSSHRSIAKTSERSTKKSKQAKSAPSKATPSPSQSEPEHPSDKPEKSEKSDKSDKTDKADKTDKTESNMIYINKEICVDFRDPKVQTAMLLGLLAIMAVALWYGFTQGCFRSRRRRSCWLAYDL